MNRHTYEIYIEMFVDEEYRQKCEKAKSAVLVMLDINNGNWLVNNEKAESYRRRKLPAYLL